jgi:bis(5'-adenosyl)-triphosphatase
LKPIVPGHVLVVARRSVARLKELTEIETLDLWLTAQEVAKIIEQIYQTEC